MIPAKSEECEPPACIHSAPPVDNSKVYAAIASRFQSGMALKVTCQRCPCAGSYPHDILLACELSTNLSTSLSTTKLARRDGGTMSMSGRLQGLKSYHYTQGRIMVLYTEVNVGLSICVVVLARQGDHVVIATTNVGHLSRYAAADVWSNITAPMPIDIPHGAGAIELAAYAPALGKG